MTTINVCIQFKYNENLFLTYTQKKRTHTRKKIFNSHQKRIRSFFIHSFIHSFHLDKCEKKRKNPNRNKNKTKRNETAKKSLQNCKV